MCGIIGYVGNKNFIDVSKECLKKLEYRGYDSAGIAYFEKYNKNNNKDNNAEQNNRIVAKKEVGNVKHLFETIKDKPNTTCGIGHTRWATNGKPTKNNAHPHKSQDGTFYVVHNGVIENCEKIKQKYLKDVIFESNTDTEIIPNLIALFYKTTNDTLKSIQKTTEILKGSFSFCVIHCSEPNKIFFAKYKSPLLIGIGKNENFISSDLQGLDNQIEEYIPLEDNNLGYITKDEILVLDKNFRKINTKPQKNRKKMIKNDIF